MGEKNNLSSQVVLQTNEGVPLTTTDLISVDYSRATEVQGGRSDISFWRLLVLSKWSAPPHHQERDELMWVSNPGSTQVRKEISFII